MICLERLSHDRRVRGVGVIYGTAQAAKPISWAKARDFEATYVCDNLCRCPTLQFKLTIRHKSFVGRSPLGPAGELTALPQTPYLIVRKRRKGQGKEGKRVRGTRKRGITPPPKYIPGYKNSTR